MLYWVEPAPISKVALPKLFKLFATPKLTLTVPPVILGSKNSAISLYPDWDISDPITNVLNGLSVPMPTLPSWEFSSSLGFGIVHRFVVG